MLIQQIQKIENFQTSAMILTIVNEKARKNGTQADIGRYSLLDNILPNLKVVTKYKRNYGHLGSSTRLQFASMLNGLESLFILFGTKQSNSSLIFTASSQIKLT